LVVQPRSPGLVIGLILLFGGMIYPMYALAVAHANDFAASDDFVKIAGGLLLIYGVGTMSGPLFGAIAMEWISAEGLFAFCALVHLALGLYTLYRMRQRAAPDLAGRETFQGMPAPRTVTPESVALDPRATESTEEPPPP
jgi:uncharacterized membrane protein YfcA